MVSALQGVGIEDLRDYLLYRAQPRPWSFHPRVNSDLSALQKVEEIIREHCFKHLDLEVPYAIEQVNTGWTPLINGDLRIDFDLLVDKEAQVVSKIEDICLLLCTYIHALQAHTHALSPIMSFSVVLYFCLFLLLLSM